MPLTNGSRIVGRYCELDRVEGCPVSIGPFSLCELFADRTHFVSGDTSPRSARAIASRK